METATVWVLVALICVEMNIACALSSPKKLQKPGACPEPPPGRMGICIDKCIDDQSCPKDQKCCSTGCGHRCLSLVFNVQRASLRPSRRGEWQQVDSRDTGALTEADIFRSNHEADSSRKKTLQKPGSCPRAHTGGVGICDEHCLDDLSCPDEMKCCSNGCGHRCMRPVFKEEDDNEADVEYLQCQAGMC